MKTSRIDGRGNRRRFLAAFLSFAGIASFLLAWPAQSVAVELHPGDIVAVTAINQQHGALYRIDPVTGDRTIIADDTHGTGVSFEVAAGIALAPDGQILVADQRNDDIAERIVRVDPATGNRTIVSQSPDTSGPPFEPTVGSGPGFDTPAYLKVEADGNILLTEHTALFRINPITGDRTILSSPTVGNGPSWVAFPAGLAVASNGDIFVVGSSTNAVYQVDPITGDRTIISDSTHGTGPAILSLPLGAVLDATGDLFVGNTGSSVFRIDTITGDRAFVTSNTIGTGPSLGLAAELALEPSGDLLVSNLNNIKRVDPATGNRSIVSDATHGFGPAMVGTSGILVVPNVPEPSTIVLAAIGIVSLIASRIHRRAS